MEDPVVLDELYLTHTLWQSSVFSERQDRAVSGRFSSPCFESQYTPGDSLASRAVMELDTMV